MQGVAAGEGEVCEDQPQHVGSLRVSASMNTLEQGRGLYPGQPLTSAASPPLQPRPPDTCTITTGGWKLGLLLSKPTLENVHTSSTLLHFIMQNPSSYIQQI